MIPAIVDMEIESTPSDSIRLPGAWRWRVLASAADDRLPCPDAAGGDACECVPRIEEEIEMMKEENE
ncbi:unnamed protein product [Caenorhabditis auriculariae]|uniref:Uncharacterized protein n=1 Tax=Caenorhabditis auriculariae TaxID=2777116 RepID=A0A8S1HJA2_9PELO|nr:unnamed protein product [Caenorhabditis auriculariae]